MNPIHLRWVSDSHLPWPALRAFEAASRHASFKDAARELGLTPTAISHQVKRLETRLGLKLFERLHRALLLTPAGETLATEAQAAFLRLEQTLDRLRLQGRVADRDSLTVSCVPSFATKWLAPRLHDFQAAHPRIALRVLADETLVDLRRDRTVDVALRYGPGPYGKGVVAERLWSRGAIVAVSAPTVAKLAKAPSGLARQMLMRTASPSARGGSKRASPHADWSTWLAAAGVATDSAIRKALDGPIFSASHLAIEAAVAGKGIALAPTVLVDRDVAAGRLVHLFDLAVPDPNAFWLVCRADRQTESRVRAFRRWIKREASGTTA